MIRTAFARGRLAALAFTCALLALPATAGAGIADLDPSFDGDGTLTNGQTDSRVRDVAVAADGTTIVVSSIFETVPIYTVTSLERDGSTDWNFGTGGTYNRFLNQDPESPDRGVARAVTIAPDGDIIVVGYAEDISTGDTIDRAVVMRLDANGVPDTSFDGDGIWYSPMTGSVERKLFDVLVQPDGTIVAVGSAVDGTDGGFYAVRLNATGTPLSGGFEDRKPSRDHDAEDGARAIVAAPGGGFYSAGTLSDSHGDPIIAVTRLNADATHDTSWGTSGYGLTELGSASHAHALAVANDKIYVAGYTDDTPNELALVRFGLNGIPDATFATDSMGNAVSHRTFSLGSPSRNAQFGDLLPAGDGKLWATAGLQGDGAATTNQTVLMRLMPDGTPDASFGAGGVAATSVAGGWPTVDGTPDPAPPFYARESDSSGALLHDVKLALNGPKPTIAASALADNGDPIVAVARYGKDDVTPPDPGTGDGGTGGGDTSGGGSSGGDSSGTGSGGGSSTGGGGSTGGTGAGATAGTGGGATTTPQPQPIVLVDTTRAATMPDVRGQEMKKAIGSLDKRFFSDVTVKYTHDKGDHAKSIGDVAAQTPASKAKISSAAGTPGNVVLTVYEGPKPVGKSKCPEDELKKELKGLGPLYAEQVAQQLKCRVEVEVVPAASAKTDSVSKVTASNNKVTVTIKQPTKPEFNELFLAFRGVRPQKTNVTFNAADWSLPVGPLASMGVTVMTRGGDLVRNAQVSIDGTDVGGKDYSRQSGADGAGLAWLTVQPKKAGAVTVSARAEVGGQVLTGVGVINVKETKGTFTTVNGENITLDSRGAVQKVTEPSVRSAGLADLWNQFLSAIGLGSPTGQQVNQPGRSAEQNLSTAAKSKKVYPVQIAMGQPLNGSAKATTAKLADVGVIQAGKAGKTKAPVIDTTRGNFIGAAGLIGQAGGNLIGPAAGNIIGPAAGNAINREIDVKKAKLISDNGLGLISDNGLGLISDNGLGLLSDNGLGLVPPKNGMLATSFSGAVAAGGAN